MLYEYVIKWEWQWVFWEHWMMFPDWRYFVVDTHSSDMFIHLYQRKLITKQEMNKYNELIWMEFKDWHRRLVDMDKFNNMMSILLNAWFIQIQWRYITGTKIYYSKINKEQRDTFERMWFIIKEKDAFLLSH